MKAAFLDKLSLDMEDLDFDGLSATCHDWKIYNKTSPQETILRIKDAEVIVTNKVVLDKTAIAEAKNLKLICVAATGTNNVDLDYAKTKGIQVCNVRAYGTNSVAQHVFTLLLMLTRSIPQYQDAIKRGDWQKSDEFCLLNYPIEDLNGKILGIIGYGELGQGVSKLAEAFGMKVIIASHGDKKVSYPTVELKDLLAEADVLTLHCPLTSQTENLIGIEELTRMKSSAILINMARGGIVNEEALAQALINKQIAGAAIDVLIKEPPDASSTLLNLNLPNLIITPHIAWASRTARQNVLNQVVDNINHYLSGSVSSNQVV